MKQQQTKGGKNPLNNKFYNYKILSEIISLRKSERKPDG